MDCALKKGIKNTELLTVHFFFLHVTPFSKGKKKTTRIFPQQITIKSKGQITSAGIVSHIVTAVWILYSCVHLVG